MRKGFSIVEVLIVIMTLPLVMLVGDRLFRDLIIDIPRSVQVAIQHEVLLKMTETLQQDLDWASQVTLVRDERDPNQTVLVIDRGGTSIRYGTVNDIMRRTAVYDQDDPNQTTEMDWTLPRLGFEWTLQRVAGGGDYLQLSTHIVNRPHKRHKLENTHLFYVGLYPALGVRHEKQ